MKTSSPVLSAASIYNAWGGINPKVQAPESILKILHPASIHDKAQNNLNNLNIKLVDKERPWKHSEGSCFSHCTC